ncbi:MAG: flagellar M-ring protein FliF C-terminal domain-containing protein [Phycisphaerae bacterium]
MDFVRQLIARINTQLTDLSASQRVAIGLCALVIVGSFLWLVQWSVKPQYVRLLEEPMTTEQLAVARQHLPAERFRIVGDSIWVTPADRHTLFWQLQSAGALPADTSITFAKLIEDDSPFRPESENHFRRQVALQNEMAKVIASSPLVKSAEVFITDTSNRRISAAHVRPTASIKVTMAAGRTLTQDVVKACAELVAGAVPGLVPHRVSVIDGATLRPFKVLDPEEEFAQGQLQEKKKHEEHLRKKIEGQLSYIPGVRVSVSVQLDGSRKRTREITYAQPAVAEEKTSTTETRSGGPSGESGVGPNVGQALAGNASGNSETTEETTTKFQDQPLARETTTQFLPFNVLRTTASIGIPRSYIVGVLRRMSGSEQEPDENEISTRLEEEKRRVRSAVRNIVMARSDDDITVDLYPGLSPAVTILPDGTLAASVAAVSGDTPVELLKRYAPQGGLALLAVVGLYMLARLARQSARDAQTFYQSRTRKEAGEDGGDEELLPGGGGPVGKAQPAAGGALEAVEVDADTMRASQMTEQVGRLVEDDPATVARILGRWTEAQE